MLFLLIIGCESGVLLPLAAAASDSDCRAMKSRCRRVLSFRPSTIMLLLLLLLLFALGVAAVLTACSPRLSFI